MEDVAPQRSPANPRWPIAVAVALTFGAGALDVLALTNLGGVFASVMTGNLALLGLGLARGDTGGILHAVVAVFGYAAGVAVGSRITGVRSADHDTWPARVTATLTLQLVLQCALAVGWYATHAAPTGTIRMVLLASAAVSMGLQGAAVRGLGVPLATTYLTGTLTALVAAGASSPRVRGHGPGLAALIAAVGGAICGGLMLMLAPGATPLLSVVPLAAVVVIAGYRRRHAGEAGAPLIN